MKERIQFLFIYFGFWVVYFLGARFLFLSYHIASTKLLTLETLGIIFARGLRIDLSMAAALSIIPFLWVGFSEYIKKSVFENTLFTYTLGAVFSLTLISVIDLEVYAVWNYRIDATPLAYLDSGKDVLRSIKNAPYIRLIVSYILLIILASYFVYRIIAQKISTWKHIEPVPLLVASALMTVLLVIPLRGGLGKTNLNHSSAYFSENNFANIATLNASWNFGYSLISKSYGKGNPYSYLPKNQLNSTFKKLFNLDSQAKDILRVKRPNILLVVLDDFELKKYSSSSVIISSSDSVKTNGLNDILTFNHVYQADAKPDFGLLNILSGYPSPPKEYVLENPKKISELTFLTSNLNAKNYLTSFYYGGDAEFDNLKPFLFAANFDVVIDQLAFSQEQSIFDKYLIDITSTEPRFDVLVQPKANNGLNQNAFYEQRLQELFNNLKKRGLWENTLVIVTGHRDLSNELTTLTLENFHIPMFWTGGALLQHGQNNSYGSLTDIPKSILNTLGVSNENFTFSKTLFSKTSESWAYVSYPNYIGYINQNGYLVFDNDNKAIVQKEGNFTEENLIKAKAYLQKSFQDYLQK